MAARGAAGLAAHAPSCSQHPARLAEYLGMSEMANLTRRAHRCADARCVGLLLDAVQGRPLAGAAVPVI